MARKALTMRKSKGVFHHLAGKTHKKNILPSLKRGGYRE